MKQLDNKSQKEILRSLNNAKIHIRCAKMPEENRHMPFKRHLEIATSFIEYAERIINNGI